MTQLEYIICDVFTERQFGGNPLAVFPHVTDLSSAEMQKIAREFNFTETTFALPPNGHADYNVRIFTPTREVPFAGHPTVGTAFVLDYLAKKQGRKGWNSLVFEQLAGEVHAEKQVLLDGTEGFYVAAPEAFSVGKSIPSQLVAEALTLPLKDIDETFHQPVWVSSGLPFIVVQLVSSQSLGSIKLNLQGFEKIRQFGVEPDILAYVKQPQDNQLRCRMFAPFDGVNEDPATGSANCALAGLLASLDTASQGDYHYQVIQGEEMGRASKLYSRATKTLGNVSSTGVAGSAVLFSQGTITLI